MIRALFAAFAMGTILAVAAAETSAGEPTPNPGDASATYQIHQALTVKDIPSGSKQARIWFWLPDDTAEQKVLDLAVPTAPAQWKITRDPANGHRYLYAEVNDPGATLSIATDIVLRRKATSVQLDAAKAGPITADHRKLFAQYLEKNCPGMEVNEELSELANKICETDKNVVSQARKIFLWIVANTEHYSKSKTAPKSSNRGSAMYCLSNKGGACTDQHALFIALCRARDIPTRLHFGSRLQPQNEGKDHNPGYRCWVQYFVPNYGWVSTDLSAANTNRGKEDFYFSGLDERRIWFSEGRDLELQPRQAGEKLNLFIIAYVEVDGRPHTSFERTLRFTEKNTK